MDALRVFSQPVHAFLPQSCAYSHEDVFTGTAASDNALQSSFVNENSCPLLGQESSCAGEASGESAGRMDHFREANIYFLKLHELTQTVEAFCADTRRNDKCIKTAQVLPRLYKCLECVCFCAKTLDIYQSLPALLDRYLPRLITPLTAVVVKNLGLLATRLSGGEACTLSMKDCINLPCCPSSPFSKSAVSEGSTLPGEVGVEAALRNKLPTSGMLPATYGSDVVQKGNRDCTKYRMILKGFNDQCNVRRLQNENEVYEAAACVGLRLLNHMLYVICKVRGYKAVRPFFPQGPEFFESLVEILEILLRNEVLPPSLAADAPDRTATPSNEQCIPICKSSKESDFLHGKSDQAETPYRSSGLRKSSTSVSCVANSSCLSSSKNQNVAFASINNENGVLYCSEAEKNECDSTNNRYSNNDSLQETAEGKMQAILLLADQVPLWSTHYSLLIWLSLVVLAPFDLDTLDSSVISSTREVHEIRLEEQQQPRQHQRRLGMRFVLVIQAYIRWTSNKAGDAAAFAVGRFFSRPDLKKKAGECLQVFLVFCQNLLASHTSEGSIDFPTLVKAGLSSRSAICAFARSPPGEATLLQNENATPLFAQANAMRALNEILKHITREAILPELSTVLHLIESKQLTGATGGGGCYAGDASTSALFRKLRCSCAARLCMLLLPPKSNASHHWRYTPYARNLETLLRRQQEQDGFLQQEHQEHGQPNAIHPQKQQQTQHEQHTEGEPQPLQIQQRGPQWQVSNTLQPEQREQRTQHQQKEDLLYQQRQQQKMSNYEHGSVEKQQLECVSAFASSSCAAGCARVEVVAEGEADVPEAVEDVVGLLLESLSDRHTIVRWGAAKAVARVVMQLPKDFADQVVSSILEGMTQALASPDLLKTERLWHGSCLSLGELLRRGLIDLTRISACSTLLCIALSLHSGAVNSAAARSISCCSDSGGIAAIADCRQCSHSGSSILEATAAALSECSGSTTATVAAAAQLRDAASFAVWSMARAYYKTDALQCNVKRLAEALLLVALFDKEVNCRRAAAAAFQELEGRHGGISFGLKIITIADFFALSTCRSSYMKAAPQVAALSDEYGELLMTALILLLLQHSEAAMRVLAGGALNRIAIVHRKNMRKHVLLLVEKATASGESLSVRHGALLGLTAFVHSFEHPLKQLHTTETKTQIVASTSAAAASSECSKNDGIEYVVLDEELQKELRQVVVRIEKQRQYRGKGGDLIRTGVCRLLQALAQSRSITFKAATAKRYFSTILEGLRHFSESVQLTAAEALRPLMHKRFTAAEAAETLQRLLLLLSNAAEHVAARRGIALALATLPPYLYCSSQQQKQEELTNQQQQQQQWTKLQKQELNEKQQPILAHRRLRLLERPHPQKKQQQIVEANWQLLDVLRQEATARVPLGNASLNDAQTRRNALIALGFMLEALLHNKKTPRKKRLYSADATAGVAAVAAKKAPTTPAIFSVAAATPPAVTTAPVQGHHSQLQQQKQQRESAGDKTASGAVEEKTGLPAAATLLQATHVAAVGTMPAVFALAAPTEAATTTAESLVAALRVSELGGMTASAGTTTTGAASAVYDSAFCLDWLFDVAVTLEACSNDFQADRRGDVGCWVREVCAEIATFLLENIDWEAVCISCTSENSNSIRSDHRREILAQCNDNSREHSCTTCSSTNDGVSCSHSSHSSGSNSKRSYSEGYSNRYNSSSLRDKNSNSNTIENSSVEQSVCEEKENAANATYVKNILLGLLIKMAFGNADRTRSRAVFLLYRLVAPFPLAARRRGQVSNEIPVSLKCEQLASDISSEHMKGVSCGTEHGRTRSVSPNSSSREGDSENNTSYSCKTEKRMPFCDNRSSTLSPEKIRRSCFIESKMPQTDNAFLIRKSTFRGQSAFLPFQMEWVWGRVFHDYSYELGPGNVYPRMDSLLPTLAAPAPCLLTPESFSRKTEIASSLPAALLQHLLVPLAKRQCHLVKKPKASSPFVDLNLSKFSAADATASTATSTTAADAPVTVASADTAAACTTTTTSAEPAHAAESIAAAGPAPTERRLGETYQAFVKEGVEMKWGIWEKAETDKEFYGGGRRKEVQSDESAVTEDLEEKPLESSQNANENLNFSYFLLNASIYDGGHAALQKTSKAGVMLRLPVFTSITAVYEALLPLLLLPPPLSLKAAQGICLGVGASGSSSSQCAAQQLLSFLADLQQAEKNLEIKNDEEEKVVVATPATEVKTAARTGAARTAAAGAVAAAAAVQATTADPSLAARGTTPAAAAVPPALSPATEAQESELCVPVVQHKGSSSHPAVHSTYSLQQQRSELQRSTPTDMISGEALSREDLIRAMVGARRDAGKLNVDSSPLEQLTKRRNTIVEDISNLFVTVLEDSVAAAMNFRKQGDILATGNEKFTLTALRCTTLICANSGLSCDDMIRMWNVVDKHFLPCNEGISFERAKTTCESVIALAVGASLPPACGDGNLRGGSAAAAGESRVTAEVGAANLEMGLRTLRKRALCTAFQFLSHGFPRLRQLTAQTLYQSVLLPLSPALSDAEISSACGNITAPTITGNEFVLNKAELEEARCIVTQTPWMELSCDQTRELLYRLACLFHVVAEWKTMQQ